MMELRERGGREKKVKKERENQGHEWSNKSPTASWAHLFFHKEHTNMQQHHHNPIKTDRFKKPFK